MPHLSLAFLGAFQIMLDGAPVTAFDSNKVRALLAYLAVEADRPHRRETLVGLLWPDTPEPSARRSLSQALFNLRQAIGDPQADPPFLLISRETIQFNAASNHNLDVAAFKALLAESDRHPHPSLERCSVCAPHLQQAVELYRGDFLAEFFLEDSTVFDEWALLHRENLHRRALTALAHLADYYEQQGEYTTATRLASRQLELDAWREEAHQQLMRLLALSGQRSAALAQYETCRRVLAAELGVEPTTETKALYEEIKAGGQKLKPRPKLPLEPPFPSVGAGVERDRRRISPLPPRSPTPLPIPLTPFVGRERELTELARLLADPACRLITLVGPGGMGKTRLALQAATNQRQAFADGAAFVSLASLSSGDLIAPALADALGFTAYGPVDLQGQLLNYLREKSLLLVLDNFEHLLPPPVPPARGEVEGGLIALALLREILQHAPGVKLLVTSREQLNLQGEWVFEVEGLGRHAAELFGQSARRARAGFEISERDYPVVERICRLVGEMPLAIELAASWVRILPYAEIAHEIERSLDFLGTPAQDVPERHRSIRAAFDHSWKLLSPEERRGLQYLSLFRGGFRREAAEPVAGVSLVLLSALVGKSLVRPNDTNPGRYELHELIRQYAAAKLAEEPEASAAAHDRHCSYYAAWLGSREAGLKSADPSTSVAEINTEIDNVRAAWSWAADQVRVRELNQLASALFWYYELRNWFQEGVTLFGHAAQHLQNSSLVPKLQFGNQEGLKFETQKAETLEHTLALGQALTYQGFFCLRYGQHGQAKALLGQSLTLLRPLEASQTPEAQMALSNGLTFLGIATYATGDYAEGRQLLHESLAMKRALGDRWGVAISLRHLGMATHGLGDYAEAHRFLSESLTVSREIGNRWSIAFSLNYLSRTAYAQGAYHEETQQLLQEGLQLSRALGDRYNIAFALNGLGLVSQALGNVVEAQQHFRESIAILREIGDQGSLAHSLNNLGSSLMTLGDSGEARSCFLEALVMARQAQVAPAALDALMGLATLQAQEGGLEAALTLLIPLLQHPATSRETRDQAEKLRANLETQLIPAQVAVVQAQVQAKSLETIVSELLSGS